MITIPQFALCGPDDKGQDVAPEVGDVLPLDGVTAKITAVDGDQYTLVIQSVNGTKVGDEDDGSEMLDDGADQPESGMPINKAGAALFAKAARADKRAGRE